MRGVFVFFAALGLGCGAEPHPDEVPELVKISPTTVSSPDAWRLFDRSISSAFAPTNIVNIGFARPERLAAIKVYGSAEYRLAVHSRDGGSLGIAPIDLSIQSEGWHTFPTAVEF